MHSFSKICVDLVVYTQNSIILFVFSIVYFVRFCNLNLVQTETATSYSGSMVPALTFLLQCCYDFISGNCVIIQIKLEDIDHLLQTNNE